jgi:hypothetical protein
MDSTYFSLVAVIMQRMPPLRIDLASKETVVSVITREQMHETTATAANV